MSSPVKQRVQAFEKHAALGVNGTPTKFNTMPAKYVRSTHRYYLRLWLNFLSHLSEHFKKRNTIKDRPLLQDNTAKQETDHIINWHIVNFIRSWSQSTKTTQEDAFVVTRVT